MRRIQNLLLTNIENNHRTFFSVINLHEFSKLREMIKFHNSLTIKPSEILHVFKKKPKKIFEGSTFSHQIKFKETENILGNTFDVLIIEFEGLTPNNLAKVVETVSGKGIIFLLIDDLEKCKQSPYWNRIMLKLYEKKFSIFLDSNFIMQNEIIMPKIIKQKIHNFEYFAKTKCQESFLKKYISIFEKSYQSKFIEDKEKRITFLAADRGRGKSASLGILVAYSIFYAQNPIIHLSAPKLENLKTMFSHIEKTLILLGFKETEMKIYRKKIQKQEIIHKIEINRNFYQKIEYISPHKETEIYPDLIIIDEAAAIPIPQLEKMVKCRKVFLSSTLFGYEGTGKVLKMKFLNHLKTKQELCIIEETFHESIRYASMDPVEEWLNDALILKINPKPMEFLPDPNKCELFLLNKRLLFSNTEITEHILFDFYSLFVAAHYRNSPDDLLMLSDNEDHFVFCLTTKLQNNEYKTVATIHAALEDYSCKETDGNLIPYVIKEHYNYKDLGKGIRIVRICVHPDYLSLGYGSKALNELEKLIKIEKNSEKCTLKNFYATNSLFINTEKSEKLKINWIGASMGITEKILRFWRRNNFIPIYLKSSPSQITGDHSCIVLKKNQETIKLYEMFRQKFIGLLAFSFSSLKNAIVYDILSHKLAEEKNINLLTEYDISRLKKFDEMFNFINTIQDLLPYLGRMYFLNPSLFVFDELEEKTLISLGLQHKSIKLCLKDLKITEMTLSKIMRLIIKKFLNKV